MSRLTCEGASIDIRQAAAQMKNYTAWRRATRAELVDRQAATRKLVTGKDHTFLGRSYALFSRALPFYLNQDAGPGASRRLEVAEVGIGCPPTEPWELFAALTLAGFSPHIMILETDRKNIQAFQEAGAIRPVVFSKSKDAERRARLCLAGISSALRVSLLGDGSLPIPQALRSRFEVRNGEVELWSPEGAEAEKYDLAVALNTLCHVQWRYNNWLPALLYSLSNLLEAVRPGGFVLVNQRTFFEPAEVQAALGYTIIKRAVNSDAASIVLLQKTRRHD